jgi:PAS domain S-box-containing protein
MVLSKDTFVLGKLFSKQSVKSRLALGLVSILVCVCIGASFLGLFPDKYSAILAGRAAIAEVVAVNSTVFITRSDIRRMEANMQILVSRNEEIMSAAVKTIEGKAEAIIGDHEAQWQDMEEGYSTESQIVVPIWEGDKQWGHIELRFSPIKRQDMWAFFFEPLTQFIMIVSLFCFLFFKFYLGKMLKQLDPSQAIPDRVRSALDTMAEGLLVLDIKKNIVLANEAFSELVGEVPEKLLGVNIAHFPWDNTDNLQSASESLMSSDKADGYPWTRAIKSSTVQMNHMLRLQLKDKSNHTFMVNCSPVLGPNGKAAGVMVSFDDITELEEKEIELRRSKEEAEAANRAKSDFLANMSHEIRTPMNAILGFTEVLIRGAGNKPQDSKKYLSTISSSGKHLLDLINDILDLSKVEAGHVEVEHLPSPAHQVAQEVVKIMAVKAQEKGISVEFKALDEMPEFVLTDPARLRQILTNLVGNAIKFTEQGSVTVTVRYLTKSTGNSLVFEVQDTGIGMNEAQANAVFNPFVQADSSITRRFGGTGLGLTISKRFAEALGGDIRVTSEPGKGSNFIVELHALPAPGAKMLSIEQIMTEQVVESANQSSQWAFPDALVLVVDDGDENRDLLKVVLSDVGLRVDTAVNGKDGLDKVLAADYDVVLMDVQMPEMDGYTAVRLMREQGINIPVIALTAHAMKGAESDCLAAGYSGYMAKPIDIDALLNLLAGELDAKVVTASSSSQNESLEQMDDDIPTVSVVHTTAIRSSLSAGSGKYRDLIQRFILRLNTQVKDIEKASASSDYQTLEDLAHWLKGSAGSVGFHVFTEPAERLEEAARQQDSAIISAAIEEIKSLVSRIDLAEQEESKHAMLPSELAKSSEARSDSSGKASVDSESLKISDNQKESPIYSSLLQSTPKLRPMAEKFVLRLSEKLSLMGDALEQGEFETLADLAHWLKGSAGTLGFNDFTEPSADLELAAQAHERDSAMRCLSALRSLEKRIELSVPEGRLDSSAG